MKASTYAEIDLDVCGLEYGIDPCAAVRGSVETINAAKFDHVNDYLTRGAGLTGAVDSKSMTFSFWMRGDGTLSGTLLSASGTLATNDTITRIVFGPTNAVIVQGYNAAGTQILSINTNSIPTDGRWHHVMGSIDLSNTAKRHLYVDGASNLAAITTYTNDTIDFTKADWSVGALAGGGSKFGGQLSDVWFAPGVYIDLSVSANRDKFRNADSGPVFLGDTGELPTGSAPLVFLGNAYNEWHINRGTGGDFTVHGALELGSFVTGSQKCFNTRKTCQDPIHYDAKDRPAVYGTRVDSTETRPLASSTLTLTSRSIGSVAPAGSTRLIVVEVASWRAAGAATISSATLGGRPMTIHQVSNGGLTSAIMESTEDPGGTTATIAITFSAQPDSVATVTHQLLDAIFVEAVSDTDLSSPAVTIPQVDRSDVVLGMLATRLLGATSWTGLTEDLDDDVTDIRYSDATSLRSLTELSFAITTLQGHSPRAVPTVISTSSNTDTGLVNLTLSGLAGDIALFLVESNEGLAVTSSNTGLIDYAETNISSGVAGNNRITLFWQRFTGTSLTGTFNQTGGDHLYVRGIVIRGANALSTPIGPIAKSPGATATASSLSIPSVTTTIDNSLILDIVGRGDDASTAVMSSWSNAGLSSLAQVYDGGTTGGNGGGSAVNAATRASVGATGATTANFARAIYPTGIKLAIVPTDNSDELAALVAARYSWAIPRVGSSATVRFGMDTGYQSKEIDSINCMRDYAHTPTVVSLGEDLGTREAISFSFFDVPHPDVGAGFDPYWDERSYNPYEQGTLFGKLISRQPYIRGRVIRWYEGYHDQALDEMDVRTFLVEAVNGPDAKGNVTIVAKDPLKLADSDKSLAPRTSDGYLLNDITNSATSASLSPTGIGNEEYASSGLATIAGNELVTFTRSGDALTIVRAQQGTPASAHSQQDRFQIALQYDGEDPADIIYDLLVNYAGIDPSWINLDDWHAETESYLRRVYSATIGEPTPVRKLIVELIQTCGLAVWWDSRSATIRLVVLREVPTDATMIDASVRLEEAPSLRDQPDKRVSQMIVHFAIKDPLKSTSDPNNFQQRVRVISPESELNYDQSAIKSIFTRWIPPFARTTAERVGDINIGRFQNAPKRVSFSVFRNGPIIPAIGGAYNLTATNLQDFDGALATMPIQITAVKVGRDRYDCEADEMRFISLDAQDLTNRVISIDGTNYNLNLRAIHDDIYPALRPGDTITFIFPATSRTGSNSSTLPAVDVGTWPAGFVPHLEVAGKIQGAGGPGGKGANEGGNSGSGGKNGTMGGTALYTRSDITITDTTGKLFGGGGGGAGGSCADFDDHRGGGGGGGAGLIGGNGGVGPGNGEDGQPGTEAAGGNYGRSYTSSTFWTGPSLKDSVHAGAGGDPGEAGDNDVGSYDVPGGSPGAAGRAIDGFSYVTTIGTAGDRRGPQVN